MTHHDKTPPRAAAITTHDDATAAARRLAADWAPRAAARDAERILPHAEMAAFSDSGLGAITVPRVYGGPGLGRRTLVEVFEILCAADSSAGSSTRSPYPPAAAHTCSNAGRSPSRVNGVSLLRSVCPCGYICKVDRRTAFHMLLFMTMKSTGSLCSAAA